MTAWAFDPQYLGTFEQPFGPAGRVQNGKRVFESFHPGDDFALPDRTAVFATDAGIAHPNYDWTIPGQPQGWAVAVDQSMGNSELFGHLSQILVKPGEAVTAGELLGYSGGAKGEPGAGMSSGPHLHFELTQGGQRVDPYAYVTGGSGATAGGLNAQTASFLGIPGPGDIAGGVVGAVGGAFGAAGHGIANALAAAAHNVGGALAKQAIALSVAAVVLVVLFK